VNPAVQNELDVSQYDAVILDDDPRITLTRVALVIAAKYHDVPVIVWSGRTDRGYYDRGNQIAAVFLSPLCRLTYFFTDHFIAYSQDTSVYLQSCGVAPRDIKIGTQVISQELTNAVDPERYRKLTTEFDDNDCIFLFLGYFSERKGVHDVINAFNRIDDERAQLVVAGAGENEERLFELGNDNSRIHFPGYLSREAKATYLQLADVLVLPSYNDPWGLVINEAMLFGLPIITTHSVGARELITDNGILIEAGDVYALHQSLEELLTNPDKRKQMGVQSKETIEEYNLCMATDTFVSAIESAVNESE
jgi:glycosyltransferase involved in cell wall biosynthesis